MRGVRDKDASNSGVYSHRERRTSGSIGRQAGFGTSREDAPEVGNALCIAEGSLLSDIDG